MTYKTEEACVRNIKKLAGEIERLQSSFSRDFPPARTAPLSEIQIEISPPMPAFHERTPQGFTWAIIVKSKTRKSLLKLLESLPPNPHLHTTIDPLTLL